MVSINSNKLLPALLFDLGECDKVLAERDGSDGSKCKNCCARYQCGRCQRERCERGQTHGYSVLALGYLTSFPSFCFRLFLLPLLQFLATS